jgi:hypothetical protein
MRLLEKWECQENDCNGSFLVDKESADGKTLCCPFCGSKAEATANQNPDSKVDIETQLNGCLYPL